MKHDYPETRKPTGPRPNAGRPAKLEEPQRVTVTLEAAQVEFLKTKAPTVSEAVRELVNKEIEMSKIVFFGIMAGEQ